MPDLFPLVFWSVVALLLLGLSLPAALRDKSWVRFAIGLVLSAVGILFPLFIFLMSLFLSPDAKDACRHGWIDCFYMGKTALTPLVLWASAAFWAVEVHRVRDRHRPWIVLGFFTGAIVSTLCLLFGVVVTGISKAGMAIQVWLLVPFYVSVWYSLRAVQLMRTSPLRLSSYITALGCSLPFWIASLIWSKLCYRSLPEHAGCFVATAAARGHRKWVGPFEQVTHHGRLTQANQQLITLWRFEDLWRNHSPESHKAFRRIYNTLGPVIAARIRTPLAADVLYLAIKPAERLAHLMAMAMEHGHREGSDCIRSASKVQRTEGNDENQ